MKIEYALEAWCVCPSDGKRIRYEVVVRTGRTIMVEVLLLAVKAATAEPALQEQLTESLAKALGAEVEMSGLHSGVRIRSVQSAPGEAA